MTKPEFNTASLAAVEIIPGNPIQGLMTDEGEFYVGFPQISERFLILKKNASRDLKALLGKDYLILKLRTPLHPRAINCLTLEDYERLVFELSFKGNEVAQDELRLVAGLGYRQKFCDSFGIKFDQADREEFLKVRYEGILQRKNETDAIQQYIDKHPELSENAVKAAYLPMRLSRNLQ